MNENHYLGSEPMVTEVWASNVDVALVCFQKCLLTHRIVAFDTEYPGNLYRTYFDTSDDEWYRIMKANVESTKLIQCGFTLFNEIGEIGGTWEFNFSNFGDPSDKRNGSSIDFLVRHGLNLNKIRIEGVDMFGYQFFPKLLSVFQSQKRCQFVTFQGAYDFAYFLSILNHGKLPETRQEFQSLIVEVFGDVYDLKVMAGFCEGLGEHLGLSKLAQILNIARVGKAHHAGSDSLLTALVFINLKQLKQFHQGSKFAKGLLYGIRKTTPSPSSLCHQNLVSYPSSNLMFYNGYDPNYDHHHPPVYVMDQSRGTWMYPGLFVNHLPLSTFPYPNQTPYQAAYPGLFPSYYNNTPCFATE